MTNKDGGEGTKNVGIEITGAKYASIKNCTAVGFDIPFRIYNAGTAQASGNKAIPSFRNNTERRAFAGWRRPNGPPLPCFCPKCKAIFASRSYVFDGPVFSLWNNEETCPKCGNNHAKLSEGTFNLLKETAEIISAPDMTYVMFKALQGVIDDHKKGQVSPEEAYDKALAIKPTLFGTLKQIWGDSPNAKYNTCLATLGVVLAAAALIPGFIDSKDEPTLRNADTLFSNSLVILGDVVINQKSEFHKRGNDDSAHPDTNGKPGSELQGVEEAPVSTQHDIVPHTFRPAHEPEHISKRKQQRLRGKNKSNRQQ